MATKSSSARNSKTPASDKPSNKKVIASRRSRLTSRPLAVVSALLFGCIGIYLVVQSGALQPDEVLLADQPERGLLYEGKKIKTKGPCAGEFDLTNEEDEKKDGKDKRRCGHLDSTPPGLDIRERVKTVDQSLVDLAAHDEKNKPAKSDDTSGYEQPTLIEATTVGQWSLDGVGARDWPCLGDGKANARVQLIYVYPSGGTNRLSTLRSGFAAIARRMNNIFFTSGSESGNAHQIRYVTNNGNPDCALLIAAEGIRGDQLSDSSNIRARLRERGYIGTPELLDLDGDGTGDYTTYVDRKYVVWVDNSSNCGLGERREDDSPGQNNKNNTSVTYAFIWKGCWNYGEPHELMHMLGGVQSTAPRSTGHGHCIDERDVMCYDDDGTGPIYMRRVCTRDVDWQRLDCNHNDYYRGNDPASGYLSNHWNTANSQFLTR